MKKIALIGSTGSIGVQTLEVVKNNPDKFKVVSLAGGDNKQLFCKQVKEFSPSVATLKSPIDTKEYKNTCFFFGEDAYLNAITEEVDTVVIAIVGFKGVVVLLDAIKKGKNVALANKESLVVGGELVKRELSKNKVNLSPIDSEHSAVWQALNFDFNADFNKILLTCSGGAFRDLSYDQLKCVDGLKALNHPNWNMGKRITVDCATLVNKAFEVIEAKWLYNTSFSKIGVIIHRESIIHSMVELKDNQVMAVLSYPDMKLPISLALSYPDRLNSETKSLDFYKLKNLSFDEIDDKRFPAFNTVLSAGKKGGVYPAIANGADEVAVDLFLKGKISYFDINDVINQALDCFKGDNTVSLENLKSADNFARNFVKNKFGE